MGSRTGYGDERPESEPVAKGVVREYAETILVCVIFLIFTWAMIQLFNHWGGIRP